MTLANLPLLNRENNLPTDGWYMVARKGEHPISAQDSQGQVIKLVQVVDDRAIVEMVNAFRRQKSANPAYQLLIDRDHFSDDLNQPSEAYGWITDLENRADGLWAAITWTDLGEAAVRNRRYRFLSPVWLHSDCEDVDTNLRLRPLRLDKAGLTNQPNIKGMTPLANREQNPAVPGEIGKESTVDYKATLCQLLKLEAAATDEQIKTAIDAQAASASQAATETEKLQNRIKELETKELERLVEADLEQFKDRIKNRDQVKALLMKNRADGLALIASLEPAPAKKLLNRSDSKTPDAETPEQKLANRKREQDELIECVMKERRITKRAEAFEVARTRKPELFA